MSRSIVTSPASLIVGGLLFSPLQMLASAGGVCPDDLSAWLALPFFGVLLSLAVFPVLREQFWGNHYPKVMAFWGFLFGVMFLQAGDLSLLMRLIYRALVIEFLPFGVLISSLYVVTGHIRCDGLYQSTPLKNTLFLGGAGLLASLVGTTGASMIFIRPFYQANTGRKHIVHAIIFFILIVSNVGGALTPLGDPPLFLGFLNGVPFLWPLRYMFFPTITALALVLTVFFAVDTFYFRKYDRNVLQKDVGPRIFQGKRNFVFLLGIVAALVVSGVLQAKSSAPDGYDWVSAGRDLTLCLCALMSYKCTPKVVRKHNGFTLKPLQEVLVIFCAIFILVVPALALLERGHSSVQGILEWFSQCQPGSASRYFWGTGFFSSLLDNAPTYLMFVHLTKCSIWKLSENMQHLLAAIGSGAVFMGALTYIGNAPNLMVKSTVESYGMKMPGFFKYSLLSCAVLLPVFYLIDYLFFSGNFSFPSLW